MFVSGVRDTAYVWVKKVSLQDRSLVNRAVVQTTKWGTYMSVQDRYGAILGTAKWDRKIRFQEATQLLSLDGFPLEGDWRAPRPGVNVANIRFTPHHVDADRYPVFWHLRE